MALSKAEIEAGLKQWKPLVTSMAWQFRKRLSPYHDLDDLIAIGTVALWRALETYDAADASAASFSTYARRCLLYRYLHEAKSLRASNRRVAYHSRQSLEATSPEGRPLLDPISEGPDPEAALVAGRRDDAVKSAVAKLPARHRIVIQRRYERGVGFEAMAPQFGCSRQRLQQIEVEAFRMMRPALERAGMGR